MEITDFANANLNIGSGTNINKLKNDNNINYDRMRQMQEIMKHNEHMDNTGTMVDLANNINQDLDDITNYTPDDQQHDNSTKLQLLQQQQLQQQQQQQQQLQQQMQQQQLQQQMQQQHLQQQQIPQHKKKKNKDFSQKHIINIIIESVILFALYFALSTQKVQDIINSNIKLTGDITVNNIIIYAIILTIMYVLVKNGVFYIMKKYIKV